MRKSTLLFFILCFVITPAIAQWTQLQPLPVSDDINCIRFINSTTGLAACTHGIILKTTDGGDNWYRTNTGSVAVLTKLQYITATTVIACGYGSTILRSTDGGETWTTIAVPITSDFNDLSFSGNTGYAAGSCSQFNMAMVKSTDGGLTWNIVTSATAKDFTTIDFVSSDVGYAGRTSGYIQKTFDGGITWDSINRSGSIREMDWINADTGYIFVNGLEKTTNGGFSWGNCTTQSGDIKDIYFLNADTGYVTGWYGRIERTFNGGVFTTLTYSWYDSEYILSIFPISTSQLIVGGEEGIFRKSINGGTTWTEIQKGFHYTLFSNFFVNDSTAYVCGAEGTILKTTNRFQNVIRQNILHNTVLQDLFFTSPDTGFAVGTGGLIKKTVDGGTTWTDIISHTGISYCSIYFTGPDTGFVIGNNNIILKTIDAGNTWDTIPGTPSGAYSKLHFIDSQNGFILAQHRRILRTSDGGNTWSPPIFPTYPLNGDYFYDISFPTHDVGYIVGHDSTFLKTTDAGLTWQEYPGISWIMLSVAFQDENVGYIADGNLIFITTDGGLNFTEQLRPCANETYDIDISPDGLAYAFGWAGSVITNDTSLTTGITQLPQITDKDLFELFPNPANDMIRIVHKSETIEEERGSAIIYDIAGRSVRNEKISTLSDFTIDVSALDHGIYFIEISSSTRTVLRFIKN